MEIEIPTPDPALLKSAAPEQLRKLADIYDAQSTALAALSSGMKVLAASARGLATSREGEALANEILAEMGTKTEEAAQ